ncbi:MAG: hypothetical protein CVT94_12895 [Bacteroidetes bacterium HGW-Bacteroidetes-11]|jgi:hypothetical protein|nr:MAG: hypothetical protein CVT94_12895 [Bacteroidetes bacterium HGW-Bacteroidetes-11]
MEPILITASVFATIYGIVYLSIRRKERMALLDRGLDPKSFEYGSTGFSSLKYGLLFTGIGLGLLVANILVSIGAMDREAAYFSLVSLFGGIALIVDYLLEISITKRRIKEKASENQMNSNS